MPQAKQALSPRDPWMEFTGTSADSEPALSSHFLPLAAWNLQGPRLPARPPSHPLPKDTAGAGGLVSRREGAVVTGEIKHSHAWI